MSVSFWADRPVFITGANGFIGSWVARDLVRAGARVVALVRDGAKQGGLAFQGIAEQVTLVEGDLAELARLQHILDTHAIDACFHLAASAIVGASNSSPLSTFEANIRGTWNLLEACRTAPTITRVVVASSDKAYGRHERLPYREDDLLNAIYPYEVSKACADMMTRSYARNYGLPFAVTRCANVYGGGDLNYSRLIPDTMRVILDGRDPVLRSDGTPTRDYLYAADAANAYLTLAQYLDRAEIQGQAFNFGTGCPVSAKDLVERIIALSGRHGLQPVIMGRGTPQGEIDQQYLDSEKAARLLDWRPRYALDEGLRLTLDWYARFLNVELAPSVLQPS